MVYVVNITNLQSLTLFSLQSPTFPNLSGFFYNIIIIIIILVTDNGSVWCFKKKILQKMT